MSYQEVDGRVKWVDAEDHGCRCHGCGSRYKVDLEIPDDLWKRIIPEGKNPNYVMLCGSCIMARVESISDFDAWRLEKII